MPTDARGALRVFVDADFSKRLAFAALFAAAAGLVTGNAPFEIFSGTAIGLAVVSWVSGRRFAPVEKTLLALLFIYAVVNLLSVTQSDFLRESARGVVKVTRSVLWCLTAAYAVDSRTRFKNLYRWLLILALFVAFDAFCQGFFGRELVRARQMTPYFGDTRRLTGPFRHANDFSAYLSLVIFLFAGLLFSRGVSKRWRLFAAAGTLVLALCLVGTYSRGAWVAAGISGVCLAIWTRNRWALFLASAAAVWMLFFSPALVRDRLHSLWDAKNSTITERRQLWGESLRMIRARPLLGFGTNTYSKNQMRFKSGAAIDNQYAHNGYLHIAAEIGLLGLAAFVAVFIYFFFGTFRALARAPDSWMKAALTGLVFGIFAFLIHSATDTDLHSLLLVNGFWFAVGLSLAARRFLRDGA